MDYKKKIKKCQKFGATRFQGFVFKIEDIKWKTLRRICPNIIKYYDKYCDYKTKKKLKNVHSDFVKEQIKNDGYLNKLLMRKEFHKGQNRNYHIDKNNPYEFMKYLEWNKKVHVFGLKTNLISLPILVVSSMLYVPSVILLGADLLSLFINFQCINIQNYNINRIKDYQQTLQEKSLKRHDDITREQKYQAKQRKKEKEYEQSYGKASNLIYNSIKKKDGIPSVDEVLANVESYEQLIQLKKFVQTLSNSNKNNVSGVQKESKEEKIKRYKAQ